jgi:hypothetical protein
MKRTGAGRQASPAISSLFLTLHRGRPGGRPSDLEEIIGKRVDHLGRR